MRAKIQNIKISGISACVPKNVEENFGLPIFGNDRGALFIKSAGVERRRLCDDKICASDLCFAASEKLISDLGWKKDEIDCLIFVSQTSDYKMPATSCVLQSRLGLSTGCFCLDVNMGCSGFVYGLSVISSIMSCGKIKKGLLICGDTASKFCSPKDRTTYPLFGDAGTATALEFSESASPMYFDMHTDGDGADKIMISDGGYRNPVNESSFEMKEEGEGVVRNRLQMILAGMDVFSFSIKRAPETVNAVLERAGAEKENVDYFVFHQANKFMNDSITKKLKIPREKAPLSLVDLGNTSGASIPVTMVSKMREELMSRKLCLVCCGFGVGLSWGSVYLETDSLVIPEIIEI